MKTIALYSIKGGVGKTSTAVNLAYLAADDHYRTILCDLDPQGSASFYFRIRGDKKFNAKELLKGGKHVHKNIKGTDFPNLDLLPSKFSFRNLDLQLDGVNKSSRRLKQILQPLVKDYDFLFLDCPPNITLVSENIFHAADLILVPIIPTTLSIRTFEKLRDFLKKRRTANRKLMPFFSMVEMRKKMHRDIMGKLSTDLKCIDSSIPYRSDVEKMGLTRVPVVHSSPRSTVSKAYKQLWQEIKELNC